MTDKTWKPAQEPVERLAQRPTQTPARGALRGSVTGAVAVYATVFVLGFGLLEGARAADKETRDLLITKLSQVYSSLPPVDGSRTAITLRLADLHGERARAAAMDELQSGCTVCVAGKEDRQKALRYYQEVMPKLSEAQLVKVLPQVGHLFEMIGQEAKAIEIYEKVVREGKQPEAVAEANLSLAEVNFKRRNFDGAKKFYSAVIATSQSGSKGLAAYRLAWCEFNTGNLDVAIAGLQKILVSPELSSRSAAGGIIQVDRQFQEEVSRDLATFMARKPVTVAEAKVIYELSPETVKLSNLAYLANEAERLGQKQSAVTLWRFSQERQTKPRARLEGHIRIGQLEMEQKNAKAAGQEFDLAMNLWPSVIGNSQDDEAKEMKARLRKFVLDWNRSEKTAPSDELAASYKTYLAVFPTEADMTVWAAHVYREKKLYQEAISLYQKGAQLFSAQAKASAKADEKKVAVEAMESALLAGIETGELSKDQALLVSGYESYLALSVDRKREIEVLYQKANIVYEKGEHAAAAEQMRSIAFMQQAKSPDALKVRTQAADLALDALVLLKDDERIEKWAKDFAQLFPKEASGYAQVARKSVLTQAAAFASGDAANYERAWQVLTRFDLASTTAEDKNAYLKNRLILAEKTGRFSEARDAADQLLKSQLTSAEDRQYALTRRAWLSELILDFDGALQATQQLKPTPVVPEEQRLLKLAMYADLADKDAKPFLAKYLSVSKDEDKQLTIATQLVREAKEQLKELEKQRGVLSKKPDLYAHLLLEIAAKLGRVDLAKTAIQQKTVSATPSGRLLTRMVVLAEVEKASTAVSAHQLDGATQKKLASTLKTRVAMITDLEKLASQAVESGDWTAQLVALDLLAKQSERFYTEILSLPVPAGLSGDDEQQYLSLLSQQAAPYQVKSQDVKKKIDEFWSQKTAIQSLETSLSESTGPLRGLVVKEISVLTAIAPEAVKAQLGELAARPEAQASVKPALAEIESARQAVREQPLSRERLESLLKLERQAGRVGMVSYLEGRILNLGSGSALKSASDKK